MTAEANPDGSVTVRADISLGAKALVPFLRARVEYTVYGDGSLAVKTDCDISEKSTSCRDSDMSSACPSGLIK